METGDDPEDLVTILETTDANVLAVVKSLLESAGIPYLAQGDRAFSLLPLPGPPAGLAKAPFRVLVRVPPEYAQAARDLLATRASGDDEETPAS
jgi:hypothetical protein